MLATFSISKLVYVRLANCKAQFVQLVIACKQSTVIRSSHSSTPTQSIMFLIIYHCPNDPLNSHIPVHSVMMCHHVFMHSIMTCHHVVVHSVMMSSDSNGRRHPIREEGSPHRPPTAPSFEQLKVLDAWVTPRKTRPELPLTQQEGEESEGQ